MIVWPGLRRSVSAIRRLFNSAAVELPLTHTAIPTRGSLTPSFTRATTETGQKWDEAGYLDFTALAGEMVFKGARRERNLIAGSSEDFSVAAWTKSNVTVTANQAVAPDGTTTAALIYPTTTGINRTLYNTLSPTFSGVGLSSVYVKSAGFTWVLMIDTIGANGVYFNIVTGVVGNIQGGQAYEIEDTGDGWYRISVRSASGTCSFHQIIVVDDNGGNIATTVGTSGAYIWHPSVNNITGETDQTTIRPYVSVGALIHDSQDPNYLSLPGTAGHYAGSPDKTVSTGDLSVVFDGAATDWSPSALSMLFSKDTSAGNRDWGFYQDSNAAANKLVLYWFESGGATKSATSSVAPTIVDSTKAQLAATLDVDDGAGNHVVKFWLSTNNWATKTQVGTTITTVGTTSIRDTAASLYVADYGAGAPFNGKVFSAQVYSGIPTFLDGVGGETLKADFNPNRDATTPTGTITSSTTSEVWTINGASSVVRNAAYHGSMVDGVKCYDTDRLGNPIATTGSYPIVGYVPWEARTNHFLNSSVPATQTSGSLSTGTYTLWMTGSGSIAVAGNTATITGAGTATSAASVTFVVTVAGTVNYTVTGSPTKAQAENGAFATPYILTAGVAVARNADVLTYTGADVANIKTLCATFRREVGVSSMGVVVSLDDGTTGNTAIAYMSNATALAFDGYNGSTQWARTASNAYVPGAFSTVAWSQATNDIKMDKDGVAQESDTIAALPVTTKLAIGQYATGTLPFNGTTRGVYGWTRNLSQSELNAVTAS